ncbi:putative pyruvate dehydrogenase complex dihydrolipoamide acetyltransferase [Leptospira interrogans serovar Grippotyphosa str. LT2186]|uniref:Dihydrolipoamide acetyltransferase component of pyruvate dehydrogenase complex n=1 Tax=Leptospira interrogans serovar Grippotyphosa str. LT2186 TaxID=1001599 RepID=M3GX16_LEPIR|nr:dihydrolipoamide acetyltransferase family protein [Leptospira interrogans]EMG11253.1 putative pyruvate dehydrogenase complex dihydrolipoamide acetyltransferase [Leptospira interrogans serovar Grippotyphosa str. LT2186]EKR43982.1 putative pyruvate dehydrogenase complex dihydrolipoamide acetyltransferase [Leptospira interrogans serovar Grippotyphosa str. UI 08368]EMJ57045.1 putative pyruvate dehydrogenase complex dihydrolipoamide acetyltransferase [Leptospira interrogans str. UT126]EMN79188.1 
MAKIAEMTQLSPTMAEGKIVRWLKQKGDPVSPGEIIAEVETDKAVMEMEAFETGILLEILAPEGTLLPVGAPVAIIGKQGEDVSALVETAKKSIPVKKESSVTQGQIPTSTQNATSQSSTTSGANTVKNLTTKASDASSQNTESNGLTTHEERSLKTQIPFGSEDSPIRSARGGRSIKASPLAKNLALQKGVDLGEVIGSGPGGRIIKRDLLAYQESGSVKKSTFVKRQDRKLEITGMRKTIASRLAHSTSTIPHFYLTLELDATPLDTLRNSYNKDLKLEGSSKISLNDLIIKACSLSLKEVPEVNSSWREDYILEHGRIDIGVAVSIEGGLITPYIRNADQKSVSEIGREIKELASRARERKLKPAEYTDGTFTVSNLGMFGISSFTAVINEPEAAILAVGALVEKPVLKEGSIVVGKTLNVTLSCDHRVVDGATGARFLSSFRDYTEYPLRLLTG